MTVRPSTEGSVKLSHYLKPEPSCGAALRLYGLGLACDRPRGHLPLDAHAQTIHWDSGIRKVTTKTRRHHSMWPADIRRRIEVRDDHRCVGPRVGLPGECHGWPLEIDHVRSSGGLGLKSPSTSDNGVLLCPHHHRYKTDHGRTARPVLLEYLAAFDVVPA